MYKEVTIKTFLERSRNYAVLDVRTRDEFQQGHITGAINFPLFDSIERALIGKIYKQNGRDAAILKGLKICAAKTGQYINNARKITKDNCLLLYCWRGGLRSRSLAWLLESAGIKTFVLNKGYKAYRRHALNYFKHHFNFIVLGGMTGSGKTDILAFLKTTGSQVLDLEALAHHKGSAFGALGEAAQSSNEQFENDIFSFLANFSSGKPIWVEDESHNIGRNLIPNELFRQMLVSPLICVETDIEARINRLVREYSEYPAEILELSINKISRRLGGSNAKSAIEHLKKSDYSKVAALMLDYYDRTYTHSLQIRNPSLVYHVRISSCDMKKDAGKVLRMAKSSGLIRN